MAGVRNNPGLGPELQAYELDLIDATTEEAAKVPIICGFHLTDEGNAQRLIAHYGEDIRYCRDVKTWYLWDGSKWAPDTTGSIFERAKDVVRLIHAEAAFIEADDVRETRGLRKEVDKWAYQSEAMIKIKSMIEAANTDQRIAVNRSAFDANLSLMNFPNGTLDFSTREFREHRREDMLTMMTAVPYGPDREAKYFFSTLLTVLPPDQIIHLQRRLGLGLEATTKNKELVLVYGPPYSGKSSITQAVYNALGDYAKPANVSLFRKREFALAPNAARPDIVALEGARIAWTEETPEGMVFDDATLKSLTSSGLTSTRDVYEKQRNVQLLATLVIETNGPPVLDVVDEWQREALVERIGVVPFLYTIPKEYRDPEVLKHITEDEDELTAALAWAIQGYFDRKDYGLPSTSDIEEGAKRFEAAINPVSSFIEREVIFDDGTKDGKMHHEASITVKELYERFIETADTETLKQVKNARAFNIHFKRAVSYYAEKAGVGVSNKHKEAGSTWFNLRLQDEKEFDTTKLTQNTEADAKHPIFIKCSLVAFSHEGFQKNTLLRQPYTKTQSEDSIKNGNTEIFFESEGQTDEIKGADAKVAKSGADQATLAREVKEILQAWASAISSGKKRRVERSVFIDAVAVNISSAHPEKDAEYYTHFIERISSEDRDIAALMVELTI